VQRGVQNSSNAALRNMAASQTQASFLMFLDSALIPSGRNWLRLLVDEALVDETVAAVAGRYVYPDMTVFHAGIAVGPAEGAVYLHRGKRFDEAGFCCRLALAQEVTAVSGAGILVRADAFAAVGGFNEDAGAFDDIDLCLKLRRARYRVIYCANMVALYTGQHGPGIGNRSEPTDEFLTDQQALVDRWRGAPFFEVDPGYNPHFLIDGEPFYDLASPNLPMTERPASG
jgi:cellulose synthase/poly-beta-1,6-N-acetylglucosamine synthase-like glycosyltransferase